MIGDSNVKKKEQLYRSKIKPVFVYNFVVSVKKKSIV